MSVKKKIFNAVVFIIVLVIGGFTMIALPWGILYVGLLMSPAPPKPDITYGEFDFKLVYEIDGEVRTVEDTVICEFDGYNMDEGRGKTRRWKENFENKQNNELYAWRVEKMGHPDYNEYKNGRKPDYDYIVLKNIDDYKVLLSVADAPYFLGEPEDKRSSPIEPSVNVYDKNTCYYIGPERTESFLAEHNFKVIEWYCDEPIENTYK